MSKIPSPIEEVAIVVMCLEEKEKGLGANILQNIPSVQVVRVLRAMKEMNVVPEEVATKVLKKFSSSAMSSPLGALGLGKDVLLEQILKTLSDQTNNSEHEASRSVELMLKGRLQQLPVLDEYTPQLLAKVLKDENMTFIATVLCFCDKEKAAQTLKLLPDNYKVDVIEMMAKTDTVDIETLDLIDEFLTESLALINQNEVDLSPKGAKFVADVLSVLGRDKSAEILNKMRDKNSEVAEEISSCMFTFEHLFKLDRKSLGTLVRQFSIADWVTALKGADRDYINSVTEHLSERNKVILLQDLTDDIKIRKTDQNDMRAQMVDYAKEQIEAKSFILIGEDDIWV